MSLFNSSTEPRTYAHIVVRYFVLVKRIRWNFRTFVVMPKKGGTELGTLYERIQELCEMKGVSGSRMCLDVGLSKSTLSDMKNGRTKGFSIPTAQKIAGYFGITVDELYGNVEKEKIPAPISESGVEAEFVDLFLKLSPEEQRMLISQMHGLLDNP